MVVLVFVIGCKVYFCVLVGEGSLVFSCMFVVGIRVGSWCVVMGFILEEFDLSFIFFDCYCLWWVLVLLKILSGV